MAKKVERKIDVIVAEEVPPHLRDLIATAETWGIGNPHWCDGVLEETSTEELRVFVRAIEARRHAIDEWLRELPKDLDKWPTAAKTYLRMVRTWNEAACELYAREMDQG